MNESSDAERLLLAALSLPFDEKVSVITPANNAETVSLLKRYGFQIVRVNRHMAYGPGAS
jgi:ribosomal protein S18 acetylase RimI-like enzyme